MIMRMCNDPETGDSACLEDGHDSSPKQFNDGVRGWGSIPPYVFAIPMNPRIQFFCNKRVVCTPAFLNLHLNPFWIFLIYQHFKNRNISSCHLATRQNYKILPLK